MQAPSFKNDEGVIFNANALKIKLLKYDMNMTTVSGHIF